MSLAIAMWVLIPAALFFVFMHHVLLVGVRTKNIQLHSRDSAANAATSPPLPPPAVGAGV